MTERSDARADVYSNRSPAPGSRIAILDDMTIDQIAAGEVVERPASVVKELVENSLDAGAGHIVVEVKDGGISLIRVRDDGCGISSADAPLAFARHATSKIRRAGDLEQITTLGFRGEALPSIAAVARVEMDTRTPDATAGTRIRIAGGGRPEITPVGCPAGTTVTVTDLFYNTPARRQYLKKPATESRAITSTLEKLALAHPEVAFNLYIDGRRLLATPGNGDLQAVVAALFGLETGRELLPLAGAGEGWSLSGFISPPWLHRAGRDQQVITVNGRYIYNRALARAAEECYQAVIPASRHPVFILQLIIDPRRVDVNVHPAKLEVRFQQEYELARRVAALVNRSLHTPAAVAPAAFPADGKKPEGGKQGGSSYTAATGTQEGFPFRSKEEESRYWGEYILREKRDDTVGGVIRGNEAFPTHREERLLHAVVPAAPPGAQRGGMPAADAAPAAAPAGSGPDTQQALPPLRAIGQLSGSYILAEGREGLYIIDQHAAHERCRFTRLKEKVNNGSNWPAQMLEPPQSVRLAPALAVQLIEQIATLSELGFVVEPFGTGTFLLRSVPAGIPSGREVEVLEEFLTTTNLSPPEKLLKIMACHGAVKAGEYLSPAEMQQLLEELRVTGNPFTCPHGRPVIVRLDLETLARYFNRPVGRQNRSPQE